MGIRQIKTSPTQFRKDTALHSIDGQTQEGWKHQHSGITHHSKRRDKQTITSKIL